MENDILKAINAILGEGPEEYDPEHPGIGTAKLTLYAATKEDAGDRRTEDEPRRGVPRVGTVVQRSDQANRRKQEWLMTVPPPVPSRTARRLVGGRPVAVPEKISDEVPAPSAPETLGVVLRPTGPLPPPPLRVEVEPGTIVEVPHFAAHVSRQYKVRQGGRRWHLRFDRAGRVRSCKRKDTQG